MDPHLEDILNLSTEEIHNRLSPLMNDRKLAIIVKTMSGVPMKIVSQDYLIPISEVRTIYQQGRDLLHSLLQTQQDTLSEEETIEVVSVLGRIRRNYDQQVDLHSVVNDREFEELVGELLEEMGYAVELTKNSWDGGRDLLAYYRLPTGRDLLTLVECKRHTPKRAINPKEVRAFVGVMDSYENVPLGIMAITSHFGPSSKLYADKFQHRLFLEDADSIRRWIQDKGQWSRQPGGGLWIPRSSLS